MFLIYLLRAILTLILHIVGSLKLEGQENIPASGPYIIVTNHMSKADPPLIFLAFPPMRMRFFAGEKWESHILFGPIMKMAGAIYINRGQVDRQALREALQALQSGSIFGLAPEGTRSRVGHLIEAKDGAAYLASRARVPLLPVGVVNSDVLGENVKHLRRTPMKVHIGEPFELPNLGRRPKGRDLEAYTHLIMVHIANLLPPRYHGDYADSPALAALQRGQDPWPHCRALMAPTPVADAAELA